MENNLKKIYMETKITKQNIAKVGKVGILEHKAINNFGPLLFSL